MPDRKQVSAEKTRARMLAHGRRIVARAGLKGLTVRGLAARAQVNLGTFVYHFGNRDAFVAELMESWYAPLYAQLSLTVDEQLAPLQRLRLFVHQLAAFAIENREFLRHLIIDASHGEAAAARFMKSLFGRHPQLLFRLVREAQAAGELRDGDPLKIGVTIIGSALFPIMMGGVLMPKGFLPKDLQAQLNQHVLTQDELEQRLEWLLDGLRRPQNKQEQAG